MANEPVETYDPNEIGIYADGTEVVGYGTDEFVTVSRTNDMWTTTEGCDGQVVRSKSNSKIAEIKITLLQTSPSNDLFSALYIADEKSNKGLFPIFIRDNTGTTTAFALQAWVSKLPDITYGKTAGTREWTIHTGESTIFAGGNQS